MTLIKVVLELLLFFSVRLYRSLLNLVILSIINIVYELVILIWVFLVRMFSVFFYLILGFGRFLIVINKRKVVFVRRMIIFLRLVLSFIFGGFNLFLVIIELGIVVGLFIFLELMV